MMETLIFSAQGHLAPEAVDYENAAEILDRDGWCQGSMARYDTTNGWSYCMGGAVSRAIQERLGLETCPFIDWTELWADSGLSQTPTYWNDTPGRTKVEVQDRLMQAAKKLRDEGR